MPTSKYITEDDVLRRLEQYNDNEVKDGPYVEYHENGMVRIAGQYKDGEPSGMWISLSPTGRLMDYGLMNSLGYQGARYSYRPEGTIWEEYEYKDGVLDGRYHVYSLAGIVVARGTYSKGLPFEGFCSVDTFDKQPDGGYTSYGIYKNGKRIGDATYPANT
jgi:uncharacterized protein